MLGSLGCSAQTEPAASPEGSGCTGEVAENGSSDDALPEEKLGTPAVDDSWTSVCQDDDTPFFIEAVDDIGRACQDFVPPG